MGDAPCPEKKSPRRFSGFGIASIACAGLAFWVSGNVRIEELCFGLLILLGLVVSIVGMDRAKKQKDARRRLLIAGLVMNVIALPLCALNFCTARMIQAMPGSHATVDRTPSAGEVILWALLILAVVALIFLRRQRALRTKSNGA
jgi:NO-binding membrane sensor protein with MHYT domain